jgi:hypothetical protein
LRANAKSDAKPERRRAMATEPTTAPLALALDPAAFDLLIRRIVAEGLTALESERAKLDGQLAYSEEHAARLLGLKVHVLRGERLRGRIQASKIVGRRIRYLKSDLIDYLLRRRIEKKGTD